MTESDSWICFTCEPGEPAWNMAADEAMLGLATVFNTPVLRFYDWTIPAATFGYFQRHADVENMTRLRPLIRRTTGGGLVPHEGDWTYSLTVPPDHEWFHLKAEESYRRVHEWVRDALDPLGLGSALAECCDPALPGQCFVGAEKHDLIYKGGKIAGAAQRRSKQGLLIQGSLQLLGVDLQRSEWENSMITVAGAEWGVTFRSEALSDNPALRTRIQLLAEQKFSTEAHNCRR